jgi:thiazole synthase
MKETLKCAEILIKEKFDVMVYCSDDPIACKQLEEIGVVAVMPLGSLIGSGYGIPNKNNIKLIKKRSKIPVIVDAGIGCASDASIAMELGCDGVLVNSAIAKATKPILMAEAMKLAVEAGRKSYLSGMMEKSFAAKNSTTHKRKIK